MDEFKQLLTTNEPEAQQLAVDLRKVILRLMPRAKEKIYRGGGVADYGLARSGRGFLSIGPQKNYVNLYFMNGISMSDPEHLLEGTGKKLRHVKIRKPADLKNKALQTLIKSAVK